MLISIATKIVRLPVESLLDSYLEAVWGDGEKMNERLHIRTNLILGICVLATTSVGIGSIARAYKRGQPQSSGPVQKEKRVNKTTHVLPKQMRTSLKRR